MGISVWFDVFNSKTIGYSDPGVILELTKFCALLSFIPRHIKI